MSSFMHTHSKDLILGGTLVLLTDSAIKLMLLQSTYDGSAGNDPDRDFVDNSLTFDPSDEEATATGYTGGFAGAGRIAVASRAVNRDDANNRMEFDFDDVPYGALGNGTNNTLGGAGLIKEITSDLLSPFIAYDDTADKTTNGGTITYQVNVEGFLNF